MVRGQAAEQDREDACLGSTSRDRTFISSITPHSISITHPPTYPTNDTTHTPMPQFPRTQRATHHGDQVAKPLMSHLMGNHDGYVSQVQGRT